MADFDAGAALGAGAGFALAAGLATFLGAGAGFAASTLADASLDWAAAGLDVFGLALALTLGAAFGATGFALRRADVANGLVSIAA